MHFEQPLVKRLEVNFNSRNAQQRHFILFFSFSQQSAKNVKELQFFLLKIKINSNSILNRQYDKNKIRRLSDLTKASYVVGFKIFEQFKNCKNKSKSESSKQTTTLKNWSVVKII